MKDSIYFSHDADSRSDEKIIGLIMSHGYEGYGIFWAIIEMLRTATNHRMQLDCNRIAFALHVDAKIVENVILDHGLFEEKTVLNEKVFFSKSLNRRMKLKEEISEKRRNAAMSRWNGDAKAVQMHSKSNANGEQLQCNKVKKERKENKVKKGKEDPPRPPTGADLAFDAFWEVYENKTGKKVARKAFDKARKDDLPNSDTLVATVVEQNEKRAALRASGAFVPETANPATWLNQGRWEDVIATIAPSTPKALRKNSDDKAHWDKILEGVYDE